MTPPKKRRAPVRHGTRSEYQRFGCRCDACREAERLYNAARRELPEVRAKALARAKRYAARYPERRAASAAKWRFKNPEACAAGSRRRSERFRLKMYGLTREQWKAALAGQGGKCAICQRADNRTLSADHDHATGEVRGLLCRRCNLGLGCFQDSPSALCAALKYLKH
jgi:hypothetical protein